MLAHTGYITKLDLNARSIKTHKPRSVMAPIKVVAMTSKLDDRSNQSSEKEFKSEAEDTMGDDSSDQDPDDDVVRRDDVVQELIPYHSHSFFRRSFHGRRVRTSAQVESQVQTIWPRGENYR